MAPRRPGTTLSEFQRHWRDEHAEAALLIPTLRAYVQNHAVLDRNGRPLLPYPGFDACAETDYDDLAAMDAGFASPEYQQDVQADEAMLIDKSKFWFLLCERVVLVSGSPAADSVKLLTFMRAHPLADRKELLDVAGGPYADLVQVAGALRHEQLIPSPGAHQGRQAASCELVDSVTFSNAEQALDFVNGAAGHEADALLGGKVFGRERLLATARVVKALDENEGQAER
jgi:uncharacterized protein (TIGR02118 family)